MLGTVITSPPPPLPPAAAKDAPVNSLRIATAAEQLAVHADDDVVGFFNLCLSLARGIDYAIAKNEVPDKVQGLPKLLKRVCQHKCLIIQAAVMVLMVSVKNACKIGWFSNEDSRDLLSLADEVASCFLTIRDMNTEESHSLQNISAIMTRYFPWFKMGQTLCILGVKPGYGTYVTDFNISKKFKPSAEEKVMLFVAQTDNMKTSSCLISPPQVSFLINGKGVERRINVCLDTGPQLPTTITRMLKYGTNILQAVGQFSGNYIIAVTSMRMIPSHDPPVLLDYAQPEVAVQDQEDSEIIEGPSRISLNCPISFQRIKTPVKGHLCKHLQCFDFDNFVDINSRRPSWRCPHCNRCVSYVDIRVDQSMVKILREVGEGVAEVIISADGSWKPISESNENLGHDKIPSFQRDLPAQQYLDLMDLTEGDDDMDSLSPLEIVDEKPILADNPCHPGTENSTVAPFMNNSNVVNHNDAPTADDFWSRILTSTYPVSGYTSSNLQLQQSQTRNIMASNEYRTDASISQPRVPVAVQAPVAQSPTSLQQQRFIRQSNIDAATHATPSIIDGSYTNNNNLERHVQMARSCLSSPQASQMSSPHFNPLQQSQMNASSAVQHPTQNWHHASNPYISSQVNQPPIPSPSPLTNTSPRMLPHVNGEQQNSFQPLIRPSNVWVPHGTRHLQALSSQQASLVAMRRQPPNIPFPNQPNRAFTSVPLPGDNIRALMGDQGVNITDERNRRPSSRMRGALQGQAYSEAFQQYIYQPTQPVQATRPPAQPVPLPNSLNVPVFNSMNANAS